MARSFRCTAARYSKWGAVGEVAPPEPTCDSRLRERPFGRAGRAWLEYELELLRGAAVRGEGVKVTSRAKATEMALWTSRPRFEDYPRSLGRQATVRSGKDGGNLAAAPTLATRWRCSAWLASSCPR